MFTRPFLEDGNLRFKLLNDFYFCETWAIFSMEKLDWVLERTDVIGNGGGTTLTLILKLNKIEN